MKKVRITLIKGTVRRLPMHRANVAALGLRKIGQSSARSDSLLNTF